MTQVDQLIHSLVASNRPATAEEQQQIIAYVAQIPVSARPVTINRWLRQTLQARGCQVPSGKQPAVAVHLLKRIYFDGQWLAGTTVEQFTRDLHQAVQHPDVQLWTYRWLGEACAGLLAPSHVQHVPHPETFIFVAYSADHGTITTGFQASGPETIFTHAVAQLRRHR
jgi:hypothetical protein